MKIKTPIILASKSPRRQELLRSLGVDFMVSAPDIEERWPSNLSPTEVPEYLAGRKAAALVETAQDALIIAADTVVILDNSILGKPQGRDQAFDMLKDLSGKTHEVVTGVCLQNQESIELFKEITSVTFRSLKEWEIEYYLDNFNPFDKAGAYGIQDWLGMVGITGIHGCYYNVMGLPVGKVYAALIKLQKD